MIPSLPGHGERIGSRGLDPGLDGRHRLGLQRGFLHAQRLSRRRQQLPAHHRHSQRVCHRALIGDQSGGCQRRWRPRFGFERRRHHHQAVTVRRPAPVNIVLGRLRATHAERPFAAASGSTRRALRENAHGPCLHRLPVVEVVDAAGMTLADPPRAAGSLTQREQVVASLVERSATGKLWPPIASKSVRPVRTGWGCEIITSTPGALLAIHALRLRVGTLSASSTLTVYPASWMIFSSRPSTGCVLV